MDDSIEETAKWRTNRKLPFKQIYFGLHQLIENGIAQHMKQLESALQAFQENCDAALLQNSQDNVRNALKLLEQDLRQLEEMRKNVRDQDIEKFDTSSELSRCDIHKAIQEAKAVITSKAVRNRTQNSAGENDGHNNPAEVIFHNAVQEQILEEDNEDLLHKAECIESLALDMQDLKEMMLVLSENVAEQGEAIAAIDHNVESTAANVGRGQLLLAQAKYFKTAALPIMGFTVGLAAGGPVGAVAGVRIGFAASMVGGAIGYASGKVLHKVNNFTSIVEGFPSIMKRKEQPTESAD